jgi:kinetochore protein Nuf2
MDYNPRLSMARNTNQTSTSTRRPPPEEPDPFILRDPDICENVTYMGLPFTLDDLRKPAPQQVQRLYEFLADLCMNVTRETVGPPMSAAAQQIAGEEMGERLFGQDVRDLMGLFVRLRGFMAVCQVGDFGFADLFRPTYPRLQKILSYVINFVRFREGQTPMVDRFVEEKEGLTVKVQTLYAGNEQLAQRLRRLQARKVETEKLNRAKKEELEVAQKTLLDMDRMKNKTMNEGLRVTEEVKRLAGVFDERSAQLEATSGEAAKLRPYTFQKPDAMETNLRELNGLLAAEKAQMENLDRRARALQTSADGFSIAAADVDAITRLLSDLAADMAKEEEEQSKASRHREALSDRTNSVQDVERQEKLLHKQLATMQGRTEKLRKVAAERSEAVKLRMQELVEVHTRLQRERGEKAREIERRRVRIEQTEKKVCCVLFAGRDWFANICGQMADLKENTENEILSAREKYLQLESHVNLYMNEMEQCI